jgi:hypothetical protein
MKYPPHARLTGLIAGTLVAAAAVLVTTVGTSAAAPPAQQTRLARNTPSALQQYSMWDLASEFGITATNPQPDSYGNSRVWSFLQGTTLSNPSTFTLLPTFTNKQFGVNGLDSWQGPFYSQPNDFLPQVSINASGKEADGSTTSEMPGIFWPKDEILVHPAPASDAIVGWTSPVSMTVTATVTVAKLDRTCGSGITWGLSNGGVMLSGGTISAGGNPQGTVQTLSVTPGTTLYLEVGPNQNYVCDSTGVSFTVTGLGSPVGRR